MWRRETLSVAVAIAVAVAVAVAETVTARKCTRSTVRLKVQAQRPHSLSHLVHPVNLLGERQTALAAEVDTS